MHRMAINDFFAFYCSLFVVHDCVPSVGVSGVGGKGPTFVLRTGFVYQVPGGSFRIRKLVLLVEAC